MVPRAGIVSVESAAAATAFNRIELNPTDVIDICEIAISHDGPANNTDVPVRYRLRRTSTVGTGTAATPVKLRKDGAQALATTALKDNTADGTAVEDLHFFFVPIVSGILWVARPGLEFDCVAAEFLGLQNVSALPAGRKAATHIVFRE